ncbi:phage tail protein [Methanosarcina sp. T3]|uniref:phage tail protein n=1 Tax=Methanosarcina sp. T3 TaxID=3439062 RepID=UPI003F8314DD
MTNISSYVDYLPSVLWSEEKDPSQFLGRMLCIFERILTGIAINVQVVRASAAIDSAVNNKIQLTDISDKDKFRVGDIIGIERTAERVTIDHIKGAEIFLNTSLKGSYTNGNIRINDLIPGQTTFRVNDTTGLEQGSIIKISQGIKSEERTIQRLADNFIILNAGLVNTYSTEITDISIRIQGTATATDAQAIRPRGTFVEAENDKIRVTDSTDAAKFRAGDIIGIEGTAERATIDRIEGAEIFLNADLKDQYINGNIRINDLIPGQTTFRVNNTNGLEQGDLIKISQGTKSEENTIQKLADNFITLNAGLVSTYSMKITADHVRIQSGSSTIREANELNDFEKTIDEIHLIFNPWHTNFLPWLASWVALPLQKHWSEYQQRKLISEIVSIYQESGLKRGMQAYLDFYATDSKPRIAIDDGTAILRAAFLENGTAVLHTVAYSNSISLQNGTNTHEENSNEDKLMTFLLHPSAIAADNENNYIVVDKGDSSLSMKQPASLWKLSSTGDLEWEVNDQISSIPKPKPIYAGGRLKNPTAVVVDDQNRYSVVDTGLIGNYKPAIYRFDPSDSSPEVITDESFPAVYPVDMILGRDKEFVVLDRGTLPGREDAKPQIIVVSEKTSTVTSHPLEKVIEPTCIVMDSNGRFIVSDAKDQFTSVPADLIRVDPENWSVSPLLEKVPPEQNPLICPAGLAFDFENPELLYVCDAGIRLGGDDNDQAYVKMANPAAIYRVDLSQTPPSITRVTYESKLVNPTKMMIDRKGKLIITDRGESLQTIHPGNWRAKANEFGVVVIFSQQRPVSFEDRNQIRRWIENAVDEQKPANTTWWKKF